MAKRFMYTALGILALAAAYHLGAVRTEAQGGGTFSGISMNAEDGGKTVAITTTGDIYVRQGWPACNGTWAQPCEWAYAGNVLSGPVATESQSFGSIKDAFRR